MQRVGQFEKVSFEEFQQDWQTTFPEATPEEIQAIYDAIVLPKRATKGSAGYDFFAPIDLCVEAGKEVFVPTGIRVAMEENYVLMIFPRSSLGFKYRFQMNNTVGIIDSDYYHAKNEGHIFCKMTNDSREGKEVVVKQGEGFVQGIFVPFGITIDDHVEETRTGGLGSTTKR